MEDMDKKLSDLPHAKVSAKMNSRFYSWLEQEKSSVKKSKPLIYYISWIYGPAGKVAAGIALFIMGWLGSSILNKSDYGNIGELSAEVTELKQSLVLTKMQQESSIVRIQAVNMVNELEEVDDAVIRSLLTVLVSDRNENVRLAALETILPYSDSPVVREGLIRSISRQNSPMLQIRLAEVMMKLQDPDAIPEIRKILDKTDLNYSVKTKYTETLKSLS